MTVKIDNSLPLITIGSYGLHINKSGSVYSLVGTIPNELEGVHSENYNDVKHSILEWFSSLSDKEFQREISGLMRADFFTEAMMYLQDHQHAAP